MAEVEPVTNRTGGFWFVVIVASVVYCFLEVVKKIKHMKSMSNNLNCYNRLLTYVFDSPTF